MFFFKKNGQTTASFCLFSVFSSTNFTEKTVGFSGFELGSFRIEVEHADHLSTTVLAHVICTNIHVYLILNVHVYNGAGKVNAVLELTARGTAVVK